MREIGSEFWEVPIQNKDNCVFPQSTQWFLSGRSALQAIIKELKGCHTVAMPSWCCDSMVKPFSDAGIEVHYYPVYCDVGLAQRVCLENDILFLMDYFGYTGSQPNLNGYKGIVIRDLTHSLFSNTYSDADYYFGSLRKWCGVWTGGYAWTQSGQKLNTGKSFDYNYIALREKAMQLKNYYINSQGGTDKGYLAIYSEAEEILERIGIIPAPERDIQLAHRLNVEYIKSRRRTNAEILRDAFSDWLLFPEIKDSDCPMFVPILVPDGRRNALREYLIQHEIYCPVHWPVSKYHRIDERTEVLYMNELSLVCDQRYTEENMNKIVDTIRTFWKGV